MATVLTRRSLVKGAGTAAALSLLFKQWIRPAYAASPKRVLFVYVPDGVAPALWHPTGSERSFTLPEMAKPLEPIQADCVFMKGLNMYAGGPTHEGGVRKVLTGARDVSLDIYLGKEVGKDALHQSVQLGVGTQYQNGSGYVSMVAKETFVQPDDNPLNAFSSLFGASGPMGPSPEKLLRRKREQSILDTSTADLTALQSRLGTTEKAKLDLHLDSIRQVERRITGMGGCTMVNFDTRGFKVNPMDYYPKTYHIESNFQLVGEMQMDLMALALSCGVTRVGVVQWSHPVSPTHVPGSSVGHHDASHMGGAPFTASRQWFMKEFVYLINKLKSYAEPDGTLLDNTAVLLCSELGDGALHDHVSIPFVLVGGKNLGLATSRSLDYSKQANGENQPHSKLLVSIAKAMGAKIDSFGYTGHGTGGLDGLFM